MLKKPTPIQSGRTRFARDIVAEFWMPKKPSRKAVILCDGCPTVPSKRKVGEFFARKGYWVFHLRYRGSWESGGEFLKFPPHEDVLLVAKSLNKGFTEMWTQVTYVLDISDITVIGASFGGAVAVMASLDPVVHRAVALAPAIDFREDAHGESFVEFVRQIREGFDGAYRVPEKNFRKLQTSPYNPAHHAEAIDPKKLFITHALDDKVVPVAPLRKFAKIAKVRPLILKKGGHFSTSAVMHPEIWKKVKEFLKN
jgi:pimeloyl-ACP methyl ester carboxylesterase